MNITIEGQPAFAYLNIDLDPGEFLVAESDAMASMAADLDMKAKLNGGLIKGLLRKFLGGESLFINEFTNNGSETKRLTVTQATPGDILVKELNNETYYLQPGAYICSTSGVKLGLKYAGIASFIGGEGLFKLAMSGSGKVAFGAYGGLMEKEVVGEYIIDSSHLVAYGPGMKLKVQMASGVFGSLFSGEGLVTRIEGNGKVIIQTRSLSGLVRWVNRHI
ncbi:MAG: TIGR00266 family protein [Flavobacteriales bacterium]|nr:TIGR00266 family protein [Flavobacteriales bacterium]